MELRYFSIIVIRELASRLTVQMGWQTGMRGNYGQECLSNGWLVIDHLMADRAEIPHFNIEELLWKGRRLYV